MPLPLLPFSIINVQNKTYLLKFFQELVGKVSSLNFGFVSTRNIYIFFRFSHRQDFISTDCFSKSIILLHIFKESFHIFKNVYKGFRIYRIEWRKTGSDLFSSGRETLARKDETYEQYLPNVYATSSIIDREWHRNGGKLTKGEETGWRRNKSLPRYS